MTDQDQPGPFAVCAKCPKTYRDHGAPFTNVIDHEFVPLMPGDPPPLWMNAQQAEQVRRMNAEREAGHFVICGEKPPAQPDAPGCGLRSGHVVAAGTPHKNGLGLEWGDPVVVDPVPPSFGEHVDRLRNLLDLALHHLREHGGTSEAATIEHAILDTGGDLPALTGRWHPAWPQFVLIVVHLREQDGEAPPVLAFPGATHELSVMALNPGDPAKVHTAADFAQGGFRGIGGWLSPIDVTHQFTATDEEMTDLAEMAARACVDGMLNPSTDDAREYLREHWLTACVRTLAHMRGEEHAP